MSSLDLAPAILGLIAVAIAFGVRFTEKRRIKSKPEPRPPYTMIFFRSGEDLKVYDGEIGAANAVFHACLNHVKHHGFSGWLNVHNQIFNMSEVKAIHYEP